MSDAQDKVHRQRRETLTFARTLARSGQYADCASIEAALKGLEGFDTVRRCFANWTFRSQLDKLCAVAHNKHDAAYPQGSAKLAQLQTAVAGAPAIVHDAGRLRGAAACDSIESANQRLVVQTLALIGIRQRRMRQLYRSRYELCAGPIPGLYLPHNAWTALMRENITTLDQLRAAADRLEELAGIGAHTAQAIRKQLVQTAVCGPRDQS